MSLRVSRGSILLVCAASITFLLGYFYPPEGLHLVSTEPNATVPACTEIYPHDVNAYRSCMTAFALQHNWYPSPIAGLFSYPVWNGFDGFWQDGAVLETLANYMAYGNNTMYKSVLVDSKRDLYSLLEAYGPQPSYDDMGWYAISYIRIHEILGPSGDDPAYGNNFLSEAVQIYNWIWQYGWDENGTCGGGVWFDQTMGSKQTVENSQMLFLASKLYRLTKNESLIAQIEKLWEFIEGNQLIHNETFLVADGANGNCTSNEVYGPTYNAGLMMSALVESGPILNKTDEFVELAHKIAHACIKNSTINSTFTEYCVPNCDDDAILFKGIFLRNLRYLLDYMGLHPSENDDELKRFYTGFLYNNSNIAWNFDRCEPSSENCDVQYRDGKSLSGGTVGPVFDINYQGPCVSSSPISQTAVFDLFVSSIDPDTRCQGDKCGFDPPIPTPHPLTCADNPCPPNQPCCKYSTYYTCCESTQKCVFGYCT